MSVEGAQGFLISAFGRPSSPRRFFAVHAARFPACVLASQLVRMAGYPKLWLPVFLVVLAVATLVIQAMRQAQSLQVRTAGDGRVLGHGVFRERTIPRQAGAALEAVERADDGALRLTLRHPGTTVTLDAAGFSPNAMQTLTELIAALLAQDKAAFEAAAQRGGLRVGDARGHRWVLMAERPGAMRLGFAATACGIVVGLALVYVLSAWPL